MIETNRFAKVEVASTQELRVWLDVNHEQAEAVWLVTFKKVVPHKYLSTDQVLDELVAAGWIDGIRRVVDGERTMQLVSPRRTQPWAKTYKDRAERLIDQGRMKPAGLASVLLAQNTGAWEAMADVDALVVPADLQQALSGASPAWAEFQAFPPSARRNILRWIATAKTEPTRTKRIGLTVAEAREGRRVKSNG